MARKTPSKKRSPHVRTSDHETESDQNEASVAGAHPEEENELEHESEEFSEEEPTDDELSAEAIKTAEPELETLNEYSEEAHANEPVASTSAETALVPLRRGPLSVRDPLQIYMDEAKRYPLLSPEEEKELAIRFSKQGDLDAARRLVTANLRLVVKIAHEYRKAYRNLLDLVQEGNVGLMHAVKKFDPYRGVKLSTYAAWWIRAYILKFILNNWRLVKIGTTQAQRKLFYNLRREIERLEQLGIDSPGPKLLAERLDVPEEEVRSMQERLRGNDISLDAPLGNEEGSASRLDFVASSEQGPDVAVENEEFSQQLMQKIEEFGNTLKGRDREIFELRTFTDEPLTLQQIGDRYGITRERARQIERRMMNRLRDFLKQELGDAVEVALGRRE